MRNTLFAIYVLICAAAITWPGYASIEYRVEPFICGLPFVFAWSVGWLLLTFAVLVVYHLSSRGH